MIARLLRRFREDFYGGYEGHGTCSYSCWTFTGLAVRFRIYRFGSYYTASRRERPGGLLWELVRNPKRAV